jgi:hypothetical protein
MGRTVMLAVLAGSLAIVGCDSTTAGHPTAAGSPPATPAETSGGSAPSATPPPVTTTPATTTPVTTTPVTTTPVTTTPAPSAADGTNVAACKDGRCEVSVRAGAAIPLPASMMVRDVRITSVTADRITLTGRDTGNSSSGVCVGQCDSTSTNGAFRITMGTSSQAIQNGLSVTVEQLAGGAAVLKIEPAG